MITNALAKNDAMNISIGFAKSVFIVFFVI